MSHALINDSETNNLFSRMLKELNLSPENAAIWWVDVVIVSIADSAVCWLKEM